MNKNSYIVAMLLMTPLYMNACGDYWFKQEQQERQESLYETTIRKEIPGIVTEGMCIPSMPQVGYIIPLTTSAPTPRETFYALIRALPETAQQQAQGHFEQKYASTSMTLEDARTLALHYVGQQGSSKQ